jgi:hypothetical protein
MTMTRSIPLLLLALAGCASAQVNRGPGPECDVIVRRVLAGGTAHLREQKPTLRNQRHVERRMADSLAVLELDSVPRPVVLRYRVTPAGLTEEIRISESSGAPEFDAIGAWALGFAEHDPARLDGCPVAVWVEVPLTANLPRRRDPPAPRQP